MIKIAIVEDDITQSDKLYSFLIQYEKEYAQAFQITVYHDAEAFLSNVQQGFDIVFMDIELPNSNGMMAAKKLRETDKSVIIIFVTNIAKYAILGYEVNALDYILKPVKYPKLLFKIKRAIEIVNANLEVELVVNQKSGMVRISTKNLLYVEVIGHTLIYHTSSGPIVGGGTLLTLEKTLKKHSFLRCNNCYLVNPRFVEVVKGFDLHMTNGDVLKISQPKKKSFMQELAEWLGQGNS